MGHGLARTPSRYAVIRTFTQGPWGSLPAPQWGHLPVLPACWADALILAPQAQVNRIDRLWQGGVCAGSAVGPKKSLLGNHHVLPAGGAADGFTGVLAAYGDVFGRICRRCE